MNSIPISYAEFCKLAARERERHGKAIKNLESRLRRYQEICRHERTVTKVGTQTAICFVCNKEV